MKILSKEVNDQGHITLICEEPILFGLFKKRDKFIATKEFPSGFRNWIRDSKKSTLDYLISLRLDFWCSNKSVDFKIDDYILFNSFGCPFETSLNSCIFKNIKNIENIDLRSERIRSLNDKEKRQFYMHHKNCVMKREGYFMNNKS